MPSLSPPFDFFTVLRLRRPGENSSLSDTEIKEVSAAVPEVVGGGVDAARDSERGALALVVGVGVGVGVAGAASEVHVYRIVCSAADAGDCDGFGECSERGGERGGGMADRIRIGEVHSYSYEWWLWYWYGSSAIVSGKGASGTGGRGEGSRA